MRALVVLAVLGACSALPVIPDDPLVAAERARFLAAYQAALPATPPKPADPPKWYGPLASSVPAGLPGSSSVVSPTADVAAARNEFFTTYNAQVAAVAPKAGGPVFKVVPVAVAGVWNGPLAATIPAGLPGSSPNVADTADVAGAKTAFFDTYNKQVAAVAPAPKV
ncbi:cuticle protein CP1499-like [Portunus trituberculatus]|uniref:cuticle protein CP1499-like n=1 Tax=Portunus trituberculatus TaxID=210409 RepID=UPI001E1CBA23|nr:cuticle protein CP1499-like [Portunus trituberculatus]